MRFYIETYGCTANMGNSQELAEALQEMGHIPSSMDDADAVIVNTCAVTENTERKIMRRLRHLEGERLVIAGCLSSALPESLQQISCTGRIGMMNAAAAKEIVDLFAMADWKDPAEAWSHSCQFTSPRDHIPQDLCGIVNIAEGCNGNCSYCIVPKARGRLVSREPEEIVEAVHKLARSGIAEIQLAAQDAAAYGLDRGSSLPELIDAIAKIDGDFRVRVGMMNPVHLGPILEDLIRSYEAPRVYKFLHLPVQSGSDRILAAMRRGYSAEDFLNMARRFRASFPDLTLYTDVIAGFPDENEEDFRATELLIQNAEPDKVNVTMYSPRPGTMANKLKDMPSRFKKERSRRITRLWQEIAEKRNKRYLGGTIVAQVTETGKNGSVMARSENYRKIVIRRSLDLGGVHRFKIVKTCPFYLEGEIVSRE
ncbi:MAG: tRNA (N(6)-L-threonylcarbamoyladenosine(37)-C(2))-methylthiotransferase [Methanothrix sp.]|nr:tRNA (N(6)-L-threonylcarbamoyladenosine(37)-C(2))-methylthiotransferase [Methanothrix sp.]OYV13861.1 MAG: MiaB-like tRNA modifying enzyme [Methanosaeta sp. ASM2]